MNHAPALMLACATIALTLALLLPACPCFFWLGTNKYPLIVCDSSCFMFTDVVICGQQQRG